MGAWFPKLIFVGAPFLALYAIQKYLEYKQAVQLLGSYPHFFTVFAQRSYVSSLLPQIRGLTRSRKTYWLDKYKPYADLGFDATVQAAIFPTTGITVNLVDVDAIKIGLSDIEVTAGRARFPKPVMVYKLLSFFGDNIVASEGEEWKRYRKIAAPAFNDKNGKLIWNETIRIVGDLFENVCCKYNSSSFGRRMSWKDDEGIPPNHKMTFKSAILEVSTNCFIKLIVPEWAMGITAFTRKVRLASEELDRYMLEMIWSRRNAEKKEEKDDPLSNLLEASSDDSSFTDRDLTGNIFIFLIAGHETTAHTFCFAFALLALYLDQQETLFQHINSVLPEGGLPKYEEIPGGALRDLAHVSSAFYYQVTAIPKYSAEDTTLTISSATGGKRILPVPRGSYVSLNVVGLHYSPRYWKDPDEFRPARFLESDWPRDAFISFSAGPQDCIGRKFFETEGIAVFTMIVSKYEIRIKEEPQFARETFEERKARVLALRPGITMTPLRVPLAFKRR